MSVAFTGNDRFLVLSQLGAGGMGVVYEALDRDRDVRVAIKTLRLRDADQLLRFKREFRALRDLRHPNLVELGELFEDGGSWFFTMELVRGVDILSFARSQDDAGPRFDEVRLRTALAGLAAAIATLHRAGKVHCDIKPSNVLVTEDGRVVVLDFSVVTELGRPVDLSRRVVAGSPLYMAPEQVLGRDVGPAADWYAVGVLLHEMFTGEVPIHGASTTEILRRKVREDGPARDDLPADAPADLASLCSRLLARDPAQRPDEAEILAVLRTGAHGTPRALSVGDALSSRLFVGRRDALAALDAALEDSRQGRVVSVLVEGESGVGKSALIEHFVEVLRDREAGAAVFHGQCHEREFVPYNAFDGIVDDMARHLRGRSWDASFTGAAEMMAPLLHIFPVLRGLPGLTAPAQPGLGDARRLAFFALRRLLNWIAESGPLVLVVDDIHWADADSLMLLGELVGGRSAPPLLLLATARPLESGRPAAAARVLSPNLRHIALGGLPTDEAEELAHRLFERLSSGLIGDIATVVAETGGHPMFIGELVRHMARRASSSSSMRGAALDDALRARVAALEPEAQRLLQVVAVAGAPLAHDVIGQAADLPAAELAHWLFVLASTHLVRAAGPAHTPTVTTYHDRVREAIYTHMPAAERRHTHGLIADALEAQGAEPVHLAMHCYHAGQLERAARHAAVAARHATMALAFDQAAALYDLALTPVPGQQRSHDERRQLLAERGSALENAGRPHEAAQAFAAAAQMVAETADDRPDSAAAEELELRRRAAELLLCGGYLEEGLEAMQEVGAIAGTPLPRARAWTTTPAVFWNLRKLARHELTWTRPDEAALATPAATQALTRIEMCWSVSVGLSLMDSLRAMLFGLRGSLLALRLGEPYRIARALCASGVATAAFGMPDVAMRCIQGVERAAHQDGTIGARFFADLARFVHAFFYEQRWRSLVAAGRELESTWQAAGRGRTFEIDFLVLFASWAQTMLGDMHELTRLVEGYVSDTRRVGNRLLEVSLRASQSLVHLAADEADRASADLTDAIEGWLPDHDVVHLPHIWAVLGHGDIALYRGDPFATDALASQFADLYRSPLRKTRWVLWQHEFLIGRIALARAEALRKASRKAARELRKARAAARRLARASSPVPRSWAALVLAGVAQLQGREEDTARELEAALAGLTSTESMLHAAVAEHRLGQTLRGSEGEARMAAAQASLQRLGVAAPDRIVSMLAPGWS